MNKEIRTALLSFGMSGRVFHAPFLHLHTGFQLIGAWERSKKVMHTHYEYAKSYGSLEELLADKSIDLVVVNTPTYTHYEYAKAALLAGKHVIVEKAFVTNTREAEELRDLAVSSKLKLSVFQNRRWDSDFKTVKKIVDEQALGDLVEATIGFTRYRPELSPKTHKENPGPGAGIIKDLGAHVIDQAVHLFGMPESVFADIGVTRSGSQVDDYFDILLSYQNTRVHVRGGYFYREPTPDFALHGTKGSFLKTRSDVQEDQLQVAMKPDAEGYGVESDDHAGMLHTEQHGEVIRRKIETLRGDYMEYFEGVYQAIQKDVSEPVTAQEGVHVMKIIDAAFESAVQNQRIFL